tara:strand:+ start:215 stop:457 length:243 start_codon:yes stop_codon:yes gene_type:complete
MSKDINSATVGNLIELLKELIKQHPEAKELPIRVIESKDYEEDGEAKPNYWLHFKEDVEVSFYGDSGYEQSGEVRLIGGE